MSRSAQSRADMAAALNAQEYRIARALDDKADLEGFVSDDEMMAILVSTGILPPSDAMPRDRARKMAKEVYREVAGLNCLIQMYRTSAEDHHVPTMSAAYPYLLKKEVEETNVNFTVNPLEDLTPEDREALKKLNASILKQRHGITEA